MRPQVRDYDAHGGLYALQRDLLARCRHPNGRPNELRSVRAAGTIPRTIEEVVRAHPHRTAICSTTQHISYRELNASTNQIAHGIRNSRPRSCRPVAVVASSGVPLITGMLAAMKAGRPCAPIDATLSTVRLEVLIHQLAPDVILTDNGSFKRVSKLSDATVLSLNAGDHPARTDNLHSDINESSPAFILYTSGSMGTPKGVVQTHRNILFDLGNRSARYRICPDDRMGLVPHTSSNAIASIFLGLLNGASIHLLDIVNDTVGTNTSRIVEEGITILRVIPWIFRLLAEFPMVDLASSALRLVRLGGEAALRTDLDLFSRVSPENCLLAVGFGSTECNTVTECVFDRRSAPALLQTSPLTPLPVGYAVEGKAVWIINRSGRRLKFDEPGEIVVGSRYLSAGYWRRDTLTRAMFKPDKHDPTMRLYRTGDLGVLRVDGNLEYTGRKDHHVKIRGQIVDLNEVERSLRRVDFIKEAAVVALDDTAGNRRLVGFVVLWSALENAARGLHTKLRNYLPTFGIPSSFFELDALPRLPNGKIDRKSLVRQCLAGQ